MVRAGVRPDEGTLALMLAGHVKLRAADEAMGALRSLRNVGGECCSGGRRGRRPLGLWRQRMCGARIQAVLCGGPAKG
jgi:hypothetical protein